MSAHATIAVLAVVVFLVALAALTSRPSTPPGWRVPAAFSAAFAVFSAYTVFTEGVLGFWGNHTSSLWGNQVWIDLLAAVALAWVFIVPRARRIGMVLWPWALLVVATGCIGLAAMVARCLYLEQRPPRRR